MQDIIDALRSEIADLKAENAMLKADAKSKLDDTLRTAPWRGDLNVVELALHRGADPDALGGPDGWTPLMATSQIDIGRPNLAVAAADILLAAGADPTVVDARKGWTAARWAAVNLGEGPLSARLSAAEADFRRAAKDDAKAMSDLAAAGDFRGLAALPSPNRAGGGANPNVADDKGRMPLHAAVGIGAVDCVARLIDRGACVNARDADGATPLHHGAMSGDGATISPLVRATVSMLLDAGADPTPACDGRTAAEIAEERGHADLATTLREAEDDFRRVRKIEAEGVKILPPPRSSKLGRRGRSA